jgi:phage terminase small subunit
MGPAMRALPERMRSFVRHYVLDYEHGAPGRAYLAAGYQASKENARTDAWKLLQDERIIAAIAEEAKKVLRSGHPMAVKVIHEIMADVNHKDRLKAATALLERSDPTSTSHRIDVTHKVEISADEEALQELAALRQLNVTRDELIELFGWNGLERLEKLETRENTKRAGEAKLIEGKVIND